MSRGEQPGGAATWVILALVVAGIAGLFYLTAPVWHPLVYGIGWVMLPMWVILVVGFIASGLVARGPEPTPASTAVAAVTLVLVIAYILASPVLTQTRFLGNLESQKLGEPADTTELRYMPFEIATAKALNSTTDSRVELGEIEPYDPPGSQSQQLRWAAPREPNGIYNVLTQEQQGVLTVDQQGATNTDTQAFTYGEGMQITDNVMWQLKREHYFAKITNPYYVESNGKFLLVAPYVEWHFDFPVMVPEWGGVMLVEPSGEISDLTPGEAQADPRLAGQRLYPKDLAARGMDAWAYRGGVLNAIFRHVDQTQMPEIENTANQPPYLIPTDASQGPAWVAAAEPHGRSFSTHTLFYVDSRSGVFRYYEYGLDSGTLGPNRSLDVLKSAFPNYRWGSTAIPIEPRPVVVDGKLYWMLTITNDQNSTVSQTVMVESFGANRSISLDSYASAQGFLESGPGATREQAGNDAGGTSAEGTADLSELSDAELADLISEAAKELESR